MAHESNVPDICTDMIREAEPIYMEGKTEEAFEIFTKYCNKAHPSQLDALTYAYAQIVDKYSPRADRHERP